MTIYSLLFIIFFLFLFILILSIKKIKSNTKNKFSLRTSQILAKFRYNYQNSINCLNEKCLLRCLLKDTKEKKWKGYTEKDIPGPYPYEYPYLNNTKNVCKKNTVVFISVITSCKQLEERMAVRLAYDKVDPSIQFHFFIGYTSSDCQNLFTIESDVYKDISQMPIQESFSNETIFTLYLHKILPIICPLAKYYGKMDADQYINYQKLMILLETNKFNSNLFYVCQYWGHVLLNTNQSYKYSSHNSIANYYKKTFSKGGIKGFTGSFALWSKFLSNIIYKESLNESHIIRMDDQHIGLLIHRLNAKKMNISYYNLKCINTITEMNKICKMQNNSSYGYHQVNGNKLYTLSKLLYLINN